MQRSDSSAGPHTPQTPLFFSRTHIKQNRGPVHSPQGRATCLIGRSVYFIVLFVSRLSTDSKVSTATLGKESEFFPSPFSKTTYDYFPLPNSTSMESREMEAGSVVT